MPHITFPLTDLRALAGEPGLTLDELGARVALVKGELKARHSTEEEVKVELQDTNRPDTWCVEGIARQLRQRRATGAAAPYPFFAAGGVKCAAGPAIEVDPSVAEVRPFVAGFLARGYAVDDAGLRAFISAQEVLARNFGRRRKSVAVGIYDASRIEFPIRYEALAADDARAAFVPLRPAQTEEAGGGAPRDGAGAPIPAARWEEPWTPAEVLRDHPTGREYAAALSDPSRAPLLRDACGAVLSFPPVLNSAGLGRVTEGMSELFVEVTGTVLDQVLLAANILAANLADRGARIEPVVTRYPAETPRGREVRCPHPLEDRRTVTLALGEARRLLGEPDLDAATVRGHLEAFGLTVAPAARPAAAGPPGEEGRAADALEVTAPAYRADYLHPVDAIEDFAIARGYEAFVPLLPEEFTVGSLAPATRFADLLRDLAVGCGLEETIGNLLTSEEEVRARMLVEAGEGALPLHGAAPVRIRNVMNRNYSVLRDWLLPTLLQVEANSTAALYPHRFFEAGEVCVSDAEAPLASRTEQRLAALVAGHEVGFSETQAYLHAMLRSLGLPYDPSGQAGYALESAEHPSFLPGRAAWIVARRGGEREVLGLIGEVHPGVLERWGIHFPTGAFELLLAPLRRVVR